MNQSQIRNWLGIYFTLITILLGGYILMFKETPLLPIKKSEGIDAFQIIIPVLVGQLIIIYKWFSLNNAQVDLLLNLPVWIVKLPPILVSILILFSIANLIIGNSGNGYQWVISGETFKTIITFCVTILNATTFFIISKFFKSDK